jgi:hypothetical protein
MIVWLMIWLGKVGSSYPPVGLTSTELLVLVPVVMPGPPVYVFEVEELAESERFKSGYRGRRRHRVLAANGVAQCTCKRHMCFHMQSSEHQLVVLSRD